MSLPLPSRTVCRANLAVHSLWSETGPTSQMPRAYHCELMYSARRSARAIRLRGIRGEYLLHGFRRSCQFVLQNYLSCFIQDAVRTRAISQMQTIGELVPFYLNACLPSSVWCRPSRLPVSSSLCFEHVDQWERMASRGDRPSHPTRQVFFFRSVETQPYFKRGAILSSAGKSGMWGRPVRVNQAGIVPCSRATTALAWCCILLLSKRFV